MKAKTKRAVAFGVIGAIITAVAVCVVLAVLFNNSNDAARDDHIPDESIEPSVPVNVEETAPTEEDAPRQGSSSVTPAPTQSNPTQPAPTSNPAPTQPNSTSPAPSAPEPAPAINCTEVLRHLNDKYWYIVNVAYQWLEESADEWARNQAAGAGGGEGFVNAYKAQYKQENQYQVDNKIMTERSSAYAQAFDAGCESHFNNYQW